MGIKMGCICACNICILKYSASRAQLWGLYLNMLLMHVISSCLICMYCTYIICIGNYALIICWKCCRDRIFLSRQPSRMLECLLHCRRLISTSKGELICGWKFASETTRSRIISFRKRCGRPIGVASASAPGFICIRCMLPSATERWAIGHRDYRIRRYLHCFSLLLCVPSSRSISRFMFRLLLVLKQGLV
jgi:hypothetical protein